jgi:hypothetical protein
MNAKVSDEIEQLRTLKTVALKIKYQQVFGEPSRSLNRQFLFRRIAWQLQALAEGDLSERARRRALDLADDVALTPSPRPPGWDPAVMTHSKRAISSDIPASRTSRLALEASDPGRARSDSSDLCRAP